MTALKKYQRLESQGLWRDSPGAQRREVVVNFREATLILSDPKTDTALTHWSLPAIERLNRGELPALYSPAPDSPEVLELDDPDMIAALEQVHGAIVFAQSKPGRLRAALVIGGTGLVLGLLFFVGPGRLADHTAGVVPEAARYQVGEQALAAMVPVTGQPCMGEAGNQALGRLSTRLWGPMSPWTLRIVPDGVRGAARLPGHIMLLNKNLIDRQAGPEALAGMALAESLRDLGDDPMNALLHHAGLRASFGLLTSGSLDPAALQGYGEVMLQRVPALLDDAQVISQFQQAGVPTGPYAYAVDASGETTLALIEADPYPNGADVPLLAGADWAAVQQICGVSE